MKIAVVILNWNGEVLLQQYLPSVVANCANDVDIYVADNASTDDSVSIVTKKFPKIKIIQLDQNYGYAEGYNRSLKEITADIFVLLNSDVEVSPNWLISIADRFKNHPEVAAIQPKILAYEQKDSFEYAGAAGGFIDRWGYTFCRGRVFDHIEKDNGQYDESSEIFWASGACLFIRSKTFNDVGGLDTDFFAHMEEIDLCWRIKNKGYSIWYEPKSVIYHLGGGTLDQAKWQKSYLNFRNNLFLIIKNDYSSWFYPKFIFRLFLDAISALKFLFDGYPKHTYSVLKAHVFMYLKLPKMLMKRWALKNDLKEPNNVGVFKKSVVWQYFVKKLKTFSDINSSTKKPRLT